MSKPGKAPVGPASPRPRIGVASPGAPGATIHDVAAVKRLREAYLRNGYVRRQNPVRVTEEGSRAYRKGEEVRLTASSAMELRLVRRLLRQTGFTSGRPFVKGRQYRLPVYGRAQVDRFLRLIGA